MRKYTRPRTPARDIMHDMQDRDFLMKAIDKAKESVAQGGFPAGAIIVKNNEIIGSGISTGNILFDPTSHGEIAAIRNACKNLNSANLDGAVIYSSLAIFIHVLVVFVLCFFLK